MARAAAWKRVASTIVLLPIFVWAVAFAPAWVFRLIVVLASAVALWELTRMFERAGRATSPALVITAGTAVTASFLVPGASVAVLTAATVIMLAASVWRAGPPSAEPAMVALFAIVYVGWLLGYTLFLHGLPGGPRLILFLVGVTWVGETAAYAVGSWIGRHRLAPRISPGKTVEGAMGQLLASIGAAVGLASLVPGVSVATAAGAGALLGVVGQVGDLAESVVKRSLGTKDASDIIPGHGGLLDRVDGLLFNTPALYYYVTVLGVSRTGAQP